MQLTFQSVASVLVAGPTIYAVVTSGFWPFYPSIAFVLGAVGLSLRRDTTPETHRIVQFGCLVILFSTLAIAQ